jgi:hypothetical protein
MQLLYCFLLFSQTVTAIVNALILEVVLFLIQDLLGRIALEVLQLLIVLALVILSLLVECVLLQTLRLLHVVSTKLITNWPVLRVAILQLVQIGVVNLLNSN